MLASHLHFRILTDSAVSVHLLWIFWDDSCNLPSKHYMSEMETKTKSYSSVVIKKWVIMQKYEAFNVLVIVCFICSTSFSSSYVGWVFDTSPHEDQSERNHRWFQCTNYCTFPQIVSSSVSLQEDYLCEFNICSHEFLSGLFGSYEIMHSEYLRVC